MEPWSVPELPSQWRSVRVGDLSARFRPAAEADNPLTGGRNEACCSRSPCGDLRRVKCRHYLRYCDDFVLLSADRDELLAWRGRIEDYLREALAVELNPRERLRPLSDGVDFLGYMVRRDYRLVRRPGSQCAQDAAAGLPGAPGVGTRRDSDLPLRGGGLGAASGGAVVLSGASQHAPMRTNCGRRCGAGMGGWRSISTGMQRPSGSSRAGRCPMG